MSHEHDRRREEERILDLLTDRATYGLSPAEESELGILLKQRPDIEPESFDRAAAALELAWNDPRAEPLPEHVYQRILARLRIEPSAAPRGGKLLAWSGWIAALAASLVALTLWRTSDSERPIDGARAITDIIERVDRAPDVLRVAWKPTDDPDGRNVKGEVVWSASQQDGYLRIEGLAANDPKLRQYQLWIFDKSRDERYPVDGGVFDIAASSASSVGGAGIVIPIHARLRVDEPKLFAVTVEKPGGVVVSSRERIVALASL